MLIVLIYNQNVTVAVVSLCVIGFAYGAIIAVYPYAVAYYFGAAAAAKIYGRVFTAWGLAGLGAPWLAGYLFDLNGTDKLLDKGYKVENLIDFPGH